MEKFDIIRTLMFLPGIILGLTIHEYCHALVAHWCGDNTSKDMGRVTLNPLKHIDPLGFIMLLVVGFGWAKPVVFNEQNLRNPKTDVIKIALAGPLSNALTAMILSIILVLAASAYPGLYSYDVSRVKDIFIWAIFINWGLFIFNLIPIPPLDGSHLLLYPLRRFPDVYNALYKYGSLLLFGILIVSSITKSNLVPIGSAIQFLEVGFLNLIGYR
jgi:Zn-dependent protease